MERVFGLRESATRNSTNRAQTNERWKNERFGCRRADSGHRKVCELKVYETSENVPDVTTQQVSQKWLADFFETIHRRERVSEVRVCEGSGRGVCQIG